MLLDKFNYNFTRYEKLGIVGDNGCGKSTFLKLLTGIERPDSGTIEVGETVRFGYYAQQGLSFDENAKVIDVVSEIAEQIELGDGRRLSASQFLQHFLFTPETQYSFVARLSGGERRRLYLCTVLMRNPNFLILDEPTAGLDPAGRDEILGLVSKMHRELGITILLVSHSMEDVAEYVDRIIVMNHGAVMFDALPKQVFAHYKELEAVGLAAPQVTYLVHELAERGLPVDTQATTAREAAQTILSALREKNVI